MGSDIPRSLIWGVVAATVTILAWRGASLWQATELPLIMAMNGVGLCFLIVGVDTLIGQRFAASELAGGYLMCQALHWGGPVAIGEPPAAVIVYLLLSGVLAQALLVHAATRITQAVIRPWQLFAIYVPTMLIVVLGGTSAFGLYDIDAFLLGHLIQDNLFAVIALILLLGKPGMGRQFGWVLLIGWLPPLVGAGFDEVFGPLDIAGHGLAPLNVIYIAIPIGFFVVQRLSSSH